MITDAARPDGLSKEDVEPKRPLTEFERGVIEGMDKYAWMKDGVLYVGTTGTTLRQATKRFLTDQGAL